jgi:hypothetical protein
MILKEFQVHRSPFHKVVWRPIPQKHPASFSTVAQRPWPEQLANCKRASERCTPMRAVLHLSAKMRKQRSKMAARSPENRVAPDSY